MTQQQVKTIFRNMDSAEFEVEDKLMALSEAVRLNDQGKMSAITRTDLINAIAWVVEEYL